MSKKTVWEKLDEKQMAELMSFNQDYMNFLSASKTERAFTINAVKAAEAAGFVNLADVKELHPGDRVYSTKKRPGPGAKGLHGGGPAGHLFHPALFRRGDRHPPIHHR